MTPTPTPIAMVTTATNRAPMVAPPIAAVNARRPGAQAMLAAALAAVLTAGFALAASGCGQSRDEASPATPADSGEAIERVTELGPVRAVVTLAPSEPRLGDSLRLTLEVTAEAGVTVEMPSFGEALGRFQIEQFVPRQQASPDGGTIASQTYTLQAPMSGRQRVPPLRIEFIDERPGQGPAASGSASPPDTGANSDPSANPGGAASAQAPNTAAAGAAGNDEREVREILTDEIAIEIASVLPEGDVASELAPARVALPVSRWQQMAQPIGIAAAALVAILGLIWWLRARRRAAQRQVRISAFDRAMSRLHKLEQGGLPGPGESDQWYVDLSSIVRRYLEERYGLRAPELTTEEFLHEAQRAGAISSSHRNLLSAFLAHCDRVKFSRYQPGEDESREALGSARRFLEETRLIVRESAATAAAKAKTKDGTETAAEAQAATKAGTDAQSNTKVETDEAADAKVETDEAAAESKAKMKGGTAEAKAKTKAETEPEAAVDTKSKAESDAASEPASGATAPAPAEPATSAATEDSATPSPQEDAR